MLDTPTNFMTFLLPCLHPGLHPKQMCQPFEWGTSQILENAYLNSLISKTPLIRQNTHFLVTSIFR